MTRRAKQKTLTPEVREACIVFIEGVLLNQMKGMLRAQDVEERYVGLRDRIREATEQEIEALARKAAEYYVSHSNPGPLSKEEVDRLKKAAFDHALAP
jgi:hypothetical protein